MADFKVQEIMITQFDPEDRSFSATIELSPKLNLAQLFDGLVAGSIPPSSKIEAALADYLQKTNGVSKKMKIVVQFTALDI